MVNQQIVTGLAHQNLPKCHPDVFCGDPTLFHSWKRAFKAMITNVRVSSIQEINYLRSFTSGEPQKLVDNYQNRKHHDPCELLKNLWTEWERRFSSAATITNALLERMHALAAFRESENDRHRLQEFANLCADVTSQISRLPGLVCLNFPNAIQLIAARLPPSLLGKWEKELAKSWRTMETPILAFTFLRTLFKNMLRYRTIQTLILELDLPILLSKRRTEQKGT